MIIITWLATLCSSAFAALFRREGSLIANGINLFAVSLVSLYTLFVNEINIIDAITIAYPDSILLSLVGFFIILLILYGDIRSQKDSQIGILHSFIFLSSYILLGANDWMGVFICYKLIVLIYYSLLERKDDGSSKNLFTFEMLRSVILVLAIIFYFLGTSTFALFQPMVINQDFFLISLIFFLLFTAMELGLFPFHFWFEDVLGKSNTENLIFYVLIRKIILSYFMIVTLGKLSVNCEPLYGEVFLTIVKGYVLINIVAGSLFLLVQNKLVEIISSFAMINMSLAYLCMALGEEHFAKERIIFYIFCTLLPLLGIGLINSAVHGMKKCDGSLKQFGNIIANNYWLGFYFSMFLLAISGFPLTMGFFGKLLICLDLLEIMGKELLAGLLFMFFSSMQVSFKIIGYILSSIGEKTEDLNLERKHLWIHTVLVLAVGLGGTIPYLFFDRL